MSHLARIITEARLSFRLCRLISGYLLLRLRCIVLVSVIDITFLIFHADADTYDLFGSIFITLKRELLLSFIVDGPLRKQLFHLVLEARSAT